MKIIFDEGPETIRTDEGDIQRGVPFDVSDELGKKLLNHSAYKFREIENDKDPVKQKKIKRFTGQEKEE